MRKLKSKYEDVVKEKTFVEEQLTAEKIKYENDILHLNAKLTHLQDERVAFAAVANSNRSQQQHDGGGDTKHSEVTGDYVEVKTAYYFFSFEDSAQNVYILRIF